MTPKNSSCQVRLDFISVTKYFDFRQECVEAIDKVLSFVPGGEGWAYDNDSRKTLKSVSGLLGQIKYVSGLYHLRLQLSGDFCKVAQQQSLCAYLEANDFNCTRLDICLDDYERRVKFETLKAIGEVGHYRLVQSFKVIQSTPTDGDSKALVGTCYFGKSDKMYRFYNAQAVHGIDADRWELQLRNELAWATMAEYVNDPSCLSSFIVSEIDFGIGSEQYRDFVRFDWWQSLIDDVASARRIQREPYEPDLSRSIMWLDGAVAPTLAVLCNGLGSSKFEVLMNELCTRGNQRLKPYHRQFIQAIQQADLNVFDLLV
jgi:Replication initiation factor